MSFDLAARSRCHASLLSVLALFGLTLSGLAHADVAPAYDYCFTPTGGSQSCYPTQTEAEDAMRASTPVGRFLVEDYESYTASNDRFEQRYRVEPQRVEWEGVPGYRIVGWGPPELACPPTTWSPIPGTEALWCDNEAVLAAAWAARTQAYLCPDGQYYGYSLQGTFSTPVDVSGAGREGYASYFGDPEAGARHMRYSYWCPGWGPNSEPSLHLDQIYKKVPVRCPLGLTINPQISSWPRICRSFETYAIQKKRRQVSSCDAPGSCNPANGEQRRKEQDFEFAGDTFSRTYRSLGELSTGDMGQRWHHPYQTRIENTGLGVSERNFVSSDGSFHRMEYLGAIDGVHHFLIRGKSDRAATYRDGNYEILDQQGNTWLYNGSSGKLIGRRHATDPRFDLEFEYTDSRLTAVVDGQQRRLTFHYADQELVLDPGGTAPATQGATLLTQIVLPDGGVVEYTYDATGNLTSATTPGGNVKTYHYDEPANDLSPTNGLMTGISENGTRHATFTYDAYGRVKSSTLAGDSEQVELAYVSPNEVDVTGADGVTRRHTYDSSLQRNLTQLQDAKGTVVFGYTDGRKTSMTDRSGVTTTIGYSGAFPATITEALGTPEQRTISTTRDSLGRTLSTVVSGTDNGSPVVLSSQSVQRDSAGRVIASCRVDADSANAGYLCGSQAIAPSGVRQTTLLYCDSTDVSAPNSTCPLLGQLKSIDGPLPGAADTTTYLYRSADNLTGCGSSGPCHRKGDLHQVIAPGGLTTTYASYDLAGRLTRVLDANGVATDLEYNARGWLTARIVRGIEDDLEVDDAFTRLEYDNVGQVTKVTQPDGAYLEFSYDAAHRLTGIADNLGNTVTYQLDGAGNRLSEETRDAANVLTHSLSRVYDQLGQLETLADALATPTDFTYDAAGQVDTVTDAFNRSTDHDYDPLGRLKRSIANVNGTGPERAETQFQYDALDNLTAVIDPKGLTTSYGYNGLGDLVELDSPDTGSTTYTYDEAGNRASQTDARGITSLYGYDALGRLTGIDRPTPGQDVVFTHDTVPASCTAGETFGAGRLGTMTDASGSTQYCYDRRGNLVRKVQAVNLTATTRTVGYTYNAADRLVAMTYPSGAVVTYLRDATGRITGVTAQPSAGATPVTLVSEVDYLPFGPATRFTFGNGRALDKTYDANYGIEAITDSAVDGVDLGYTLDAMGNVTGLAERTSTGATAARTVGYDGLDRLTSLNNGATLVQGFSYDATGNRTAKTTGAGTANYVYPTDSHRASHAGNTRTYDAAGNGLTIGGRTFEYDDAGRRVRHILSGVVVREYAYNGRGERVARIITPSPVNDQIMVYDEAGRLIGEYLKNGTRLREIVWLDDVPVAVLGTHGGSTHQYVLTDHLGTPRAIVHPGTNAILWRWDLTPSAFGDHAAQTDPDGNGVAYTFNLRYPGQYYDEDTGLHYNYFRDYDPSTGRYLQSDPIGLGGGNSTYSYVSASPLSAIDPFGLFENSVNAACRTNPAACVTEASRRPQVVFPPPFIPAPGYDTFGNEDGSECPSDCERIIREIRALMQNINNRREAMLVDRCNQFTLAHSAPNPSLPGKCGTTYWGGHAEQIEGLQNALRRKISEALAASCPLPFGALAAAYTPPPNMPRGF